MELHSNQISFSGARPTDVSLERKRDFVSPAVEQLTRQVSNALGVVANIQDEEIRSAILSETEAIKADMEKEQSVTADYTGVVDRSVQRISNTLSKFDEATRTRFLRANPDTYKNARVYFGKMAFDKMSKEITAAVENKLPLWTSQAIVSGDPNKRQEVYKKIEENLKPFGQDVVSNTIFKANQMMDMANATNLLMSDTIEDMDKLDAFLNSPETSTTIDAYQRAVLLSRSKEKRAQILEAKAKYEKAFKDEKKAAKAEAIKKLYDVYDSQGLFNKADQLYADVYENQRFPTGEWKMQKLPNGTEFPLPEYIDLYDFTVEERSALISDLNAIRNRNPNRSYYETEYNNQVTMALAEYEKAKAAKTSEQTVAMQSLADLIENRTLFSSLEKGTREKVLYAYESNLEARAEALMPTFLDANTEYFYDTALMQDVRDLSPKTVIKNAIYGRPVSNRASNLYNALNGKTDAYAQDFGSLDDVLGVALATDIQNYKKLFGEDIERDSLAEYGLYNISLILALQGTEKLQGTGLDIVSGKQLQRAFVKWSNGMIRSGIYNSVANESNRDTIDSFYKYVLGGREPNEKEKQAIKELKEFAATAQPDASTSIGRWWKRSEPSKVINVTQTYPNKVAENLGIE